jgi:hypothetical protein
LQQKKRVAAVIGPLRRTESDSRLKVRIVDPAGQRGEAIAQANHRQHEYGAAEQVGQRNHPLARTDGVNAVLGAKQLANLLRDFQANPPQGIGRLPEEQRIRNDGERNDAELAIRLVFADQAGKLGQGGWHPRQAGDLIDPVALAGNVVCSWHVSSDKTRRGRYRRRWRAMP